MVDYMDNKKCMLIVNVASQWPFAKKNYLALVELYKKYSDAGLQIVGFPCSQFLNQEPDPNEKIKSTVRKKYGVTFPLSDKVDVNGPDAHPVFKFLRGNTKQLVNKKDPTKMLELPWNFCRWIVDR